MARRADRYRMTAAPETASAPLFALRVTSITWERVHLTIAVELAPAGDATLPEDGIATFEIVAGERALAVPAVRLDAARYELRFNVTTFGDRREIPNGSWRVRLVLAGAPDAFGTVDAHRIPALDDASRVFLYSSNNGAYTVSFGIGETDAELEFLMRVYAFEKGPGRRTLRNFPRRARRALVGPSAKRRYARWIFGFFAIVAPRRGRILFASDQRGSLEGNLLRVQERFIERGLDKSFDLRYSFRLPRDSSWGSTIRVLYLLASSEIILLDDYFAMLGNIDMRDRSKIIQLWHAGSGFKAVGFSRFGNAGSPTLRNAHRSYSYAITGSQHLVPVYAEAFGIEEESVIPTGLPRVDWFLDEDRTAAFTARFYEEHPELAGKRVVLFAPTFRGRSIKNAYYDYDLIDFAALREACGDDTVVLFRMHHFVTQPVPIPAEYSDVFFDFTKYPDGLNLLHVTDLLVTDFSSIIYEFALLDRPMLFFAPDKDNYAATRGFHRDFDETAPGRVCTTFDEVVAAIETGDFEIEKVATFRAENFDRVDTGAADRVIDWLILSEPHPRKRGVGRRGAMEDDSDNSETQEQEDESQ